MTPFLYLKQVLLLCALFTSVWASAKSVHPRSDNGLAVTPPLGWNTYNHYSCAPNESIVHSNAQALVDLGLQAVGYHFVTVDCGWTLPDRTSDGELTWNPDRFPSGYPALGEFLHGLDLGFGVYSDAGIQDCMTGTPAQVGSLFHEDIDATTFASWDIDLLKYDNCYSEAPSYPDTEYTPAESPSGRYKNMTEALAAADLSVVFAICEWGIDFPSAWAPALGNTWRISNDIFGTYSTVLRILNQAVPQTSFAAPGQWLDLDMLEVGNNVYTTIEEQTHFSLWAIIKSPLIIGAALKDTYTSINAASLAILKNADVISYNQDSLGTAASLRRRYTEAGYEIWAGPLSGSRTVVAVINLEDVARELTLDLPDVGLQKAGGVKDVWNDLTASNVLTSYTGAVGAHGTLLLELSSTTAAGTYAAADAVVSGTTTTFSKVYGITSSTAYTATLTFASSSSTAVTVTVNSVAYTLAASTTSLKIINLSLLAQNDNTITVVSSLSVSTLVITNPSATLYPSTSFTVSGAASLTTCSTGLCTPVGSKLTWLSPAGTGTLSITAPTTISSTYTSKFLNVYFCNNDIALATSWTGGTNTRNLTISVNGEVTRIETPLSGKSSELFSVADGWDDSGTFGVLVSGWQEGVNDVVIGNVDGASGKVTYGADFVGFEVFW